MTTALSNVPCTLRPATVASLLLVAVSIPATALGDDERRGRRGPPPEALEACAAQVEGDACSFEGRRGEELQGVCVVPRDGELACRPEGAPPRRQRPEEEA